MKTFHYQKSVGFLICGLLLLGGAVFIAYPFTRCAGCWRWAYFKHWWYLYVLPLSAAAAFAVFGLSQILFWARHVLKKPYLTIENGKIDIDAEMMLDMDDIESVKQFNFWGCRMLGLKIPLFVAVQSRPHVPQRLPRFHLRRYGAQRRTARFAGSVQG